LTQLASDNDPVGQRTVIDPTQLTQLLVTDETQWRTHCWTTDYCGPIVMTQWSWDGQPGRPSDPMTQWQLKLWPVTQAQLANPDPLLTKVIDPIGGIVIEQWTVDWLILVVIGIDLTAYWPSWPRRWPSDSWLLWTLCDPAQLVIDGQLLLWTDWQLLLLIIIDPVIIDIIDHYYYYFIGRDRLTDSPVLTQKDSPDEDCDPIVIVVNWPRLTSWRPMKKTDPGGQLTWTNGRPSIGSWQPSQPS